MSAAIEMDPIIMHTCAFCRCSFSVFHHLVLHLMLEHITVTYRCVYCTHTFVNEQQLLAYFHVEHQFECLQQVLVCLFRPIRHGDTKKIYTYLKIAFQSQVVFWVLLFLGFHGNKKFKYLFIIFVAGLQFRLNKV